MAIETSTKFEKVYHSLKKQIAVLPPGMRIPSVRDVMRQYGVSQITVDRAMSMLAKDNLIVTRVGKGTYVSDTSSAKSSSATHKIAIAVHDWPCSLSDLFLSELSEKINQIGELTRVIRYNWADRIIRTLPREKIDALIIIPPGAKLEPSDIYRVYNFSIPVVLVDRVLHNLTVDCVGTDNEYGGAMVANHLIKSGHRKLAVLIAEPHVTTAESRVAGFCKQAKLSGIDHVEIIDCQTISGQNSTSQAYNVLKSKIETGGFNSTGLFVTSDPTALGALKALHDSGISIPKEVGVVGFDDIPESKFYHPSLTTIHQDVPAIAEAAIEIIEKRLSGRKAESYQRAIPPRLVIRESTGPVSDIPEKAETGDLEKKSEERKCAGIDVKVTNMV